MLLDSAAAKALAAIIMFSTLGAEHLQTQRPLYVTDRQEAWLVIGTPHTPTSGDLGFFQSFFFFKKTDAEVIGLGNDARLKLTPAQREYWKGNMSEQAMEGIFAPRKVFEPRTQNTLTIPLMNSKILYGGLVNTPADAVAYAHVLMTSSNTTLAAIPEADLSAIDKDGIWHIRTTQNVAGFARGAEILTFSRTNGKLLSGGL